MIRWLTGILLLLAACYEMKQPEVLTTEIIPLADSCYRDDFFKAPFFREVHYHETNNGRFIHTAEILLSGKNDSTAFYSCEATQTTAVLLLKCEALPKDGAYTLYIGKKGDSITAQLSYNYLLTDSSWRPPVYRLISRHVKFNKKSYNPEDILKAKIELAFEGTHRSFGQHYLDTFHIRGFIKTTVSRP